MAAICLSTFTARHGNYFVNFRSDYGARWDGPIRLRGCTLKTITEGVVRVLVMHPQDIDYKYPVVFGTSIAIEDMIIDYSATPESDDQCWLMDIASHAVNSQGHRIIFPRQMNYRNIIVTGREQGVRLVRIPNPQHYDLRQTGGIDHGLIQHNFLLVCDNVHLEEIIHVNGDCQQVHLLIGHEQTTEYNCQRALYPKIVFTDCDNLSLRLHNCAASVFMERCRINTVTSRNLTGELSFSNCRLQPQVQNTDEKLYLLESSLGTRFTNCTIHAPVVKGKMTPGLVDRIGFLEINKSIRHNHLNTALGPEVLGHLRARGIKLDPVFTSRLQSQNELE